MQQWPPVYDAGYYPDPDQDYWFPEIETMDPEEREQTIILPKLRQQLKYAYEHSGLYQKKWDAAGVNPEDIRTLDDFDALVGRELTRRDREATRRVRQVRLLDVDRTARGLCGGAACREDRQGDNEQAPQPKAMSLALAVWASKQDAAGLVMIR